MGRHAPFESPPPLHSRPKTSGPKTPPVQETPPCTVTWLGPATVWPTVGVAEEEVVEDRSDCSVFSSWDGFVTGSKDFRISAYVYICKSNIVYIYTYIYISLRISHMYILWILTGTGGFS